MLGAILFLCASINANKPRSLSPLPMVQANCQQVKVISSAQDLPNLSKGGWTCDNRVNEDFTQCQNGAEQYFIQAAQQVRDVTPPETQPTAQLPEAAH